MTLEERVEMSLQSPEPAQALRTLVLELSQKGYAKADIYELLEKFVVHLRTRDDFRESDEDIVLDVMDALTGWCHPDAQLLRDDPSPR